MSVPLFWGTNYWSYFVLGLLQACKADWNECIQVTMDEKFPIDSDLFTVPRLLFVCLFVQTVQIVNQCQIIWGTNYWSYFVIDLLQACKADWNKCIQVTMDEKFPNNSDFAQFQGF